jgi:hypothetical protein
MLSRSSTWPVSSSGHELDGDERYRDAAAASKRAIKGAHHRGQFVSERLTSNLDAAERTTGYRSKDADRKRDQSVNDRKACHLRSLFFVAWHFCCAFD